MNRNPNLAELMPKCEWKCNIFRVVLSLIKYVIFGLFNCLDLDAVQVQINLNKIVDFWNFWNQGFLDNLDFSK